MKFVLSEEFYFTNFLDCKIGLFNFLVFRKAAVSLWGLKWWSYIYSKDLHFKLEKIFLKSLSWKYFASFWTSTLALQKVARVYGRIVPCCDHFESSAGHSVRTRKSTKVYFPKYGPELAGNGLHFQSCFTNTRTTEGSREWHHSIHRNQFRIGSQKL